MLRINVLGGLYVSDDGRAVTGAAAQPRRLALLALLAVAGERGVTADRGTGRLADDIGGGAPVSSLADRFTPRRLEAAGRAMQLLQRN